MEEGQGQYATFQCTQTMHMLMAIIELRPAGGREWVIHSVYDDRNEVDDGYLTRRCRNLANTHPGLEYRFRFGTLTIDNPDNYEIFKSE